MSDIRQETIAVVGVSERQEKYGFKIFRDMLEAGYDVKGVSLRGGEILGRRIYKSLKEIEPIPSMVITVVLPLVTERIVEECHQLGIGQIWMQPGSESEIAVRKAAEYGIKVTSNACIMIKRGIWKAPNAPGASV